MIKPQNRSWFPKHKLLFFDDFSCNEFFSLLGFCLICENKCFYQCMENSKIKKYNLLKDLSMPVPSTFQNNIGKT
jgi:hypothetical protein